MKKLRYVLLGSGGIAHHHHENFNRLPLMELVGVQDVVAPAIEQWKARHPHIDSDMDASRLLARTRPDLVAVCSPNASHRALAVAALKVGAHVMSEKPMAMNLREANEMEAARKKAGRLGAINFSYRCVAAFRFARDVIASGELGRIQRLNVHYLQSFLGAENTPYSWRNDVKIAGFGALGDLGVHMLDGATFVSGLKPSRMVGLYQTLIPTKKDGKGKSHKVTTDTNASFLIEYEGGAIGTFETSQVAPGYGNNFKIEISGDRGMVRINSEWNDEMVLYTGKKLTDYYTWNQENFPRIRVPSAYVGEQPKSNQETFVRAIRGEKISYPSFADGLIAQRCLDALVQSQKVGRWMKV